MNLDKPCVNAFKYEFENSLCLLNPFNPTAAQNKVILVTSLSTFSHSQELLLKSVNTFHSVSYFLRENCLSFSSFQFKEIVVKLKIVSFLKLIK